MSGWIQHDGSGVPADAVVGVTICWYESPPIASSDNWTKENTGEVLSHVGREIVTTWSGSREPWDWSNFGKFHETRWGVWCRIIAYRNPRAASTDAGMAMLKEILDRETVEPVKRKVTS